jgi:ABC-2 type transport system permease protein
MFYPISILPPIWQTLSRFNPLFYTIDGFRHAILGVGDVPLLQDFLFTGAISLVLFLWAAFLIHKGYRLRQ